MDYYEILGLTPQATASEIRAAYKRLAMLYHPDKNAGSAEAEEKFKSVNEAYQVLSNSVQRARYDNRFQESLPTGTPSERDPYVRRRSTVRTWRSQGPPNYKQPEYRLDKEYFRIQGLSFLVFFILASFAYGVISTLRYYQNEKKKAIYQANTKVLDSIYRYTRKNEWELAFRMLTAARENRIFDSRFMSTEDSLVKYLRFRADSLFHSGSYENSIEHINIALEHDQFHGYELRILKSRCYQELGDYQKSINVLKTLIEKSPDDVAIAYEIARLHMDHTGNLREALTFLTLAKNNFKQGYREKYGVAFELIIDPATIPEFYYEVFMRRAEVLMKQKNYRESANDYGWSHFIRPDRFEPLDGRAFVYLRLQENELACYDLQEARKLGSERANSLISRFCR